MSAKTKEGMQPKVKNKLGKHPVLIITSICVLCFSILAGCFAYFQMNRFERGILDVCAIQQDAYVQLALDQINLKENRNDEQIIKDILGTMDASSNKYWTFSKDQSMLFVKDVLETNKYKGFTTATYYNSDSARKFLDELQVNKVIHSYITIGDNEYIASGVSFEYNKDQYRLCLLTDKQVLLDNNSYLEARTQLGTFVVVSLMMITIIPMMFAYKMRKMQFEADRQTVSIQTVNKILSKMNQKLTESDLHDTKNNMWKQDAFMQFINKLDKREVMPVSVIHIACADKEAKDLFITKAHHLLNKKVLRFAYKENDVILVYVQIDMNAAKETVLTLCDKNIVLKNSLEIRSQEDYQNVEKTFNINENEIL